MQAEIKELQTQIERSNLEIDRLREQVTAYQQNPVVQMTTTNINETTKEVIYGILYITGGMLFKIVKFSYQLTSYYKHVKTKHFLHAYIH